MMRLSLVAFLLAAGGAQAQDLPVLRDGLPSGAVISRAAGEVIRFVAEPQFRALVLGQDLIGGDVVQTGPSGAVGILFVDRTVMRLHPNTELVVNAVDGSSADLGLRSGTLWARAPRGSADLRIATPTAAAAVRGTDWALSVAGDGTTRLTVYDGAVELANELGAVVAVGGEAAIAAPGRPPVKVGVANRAEAPQMLYTLSPADALDPVAGVAEELATGEGAAGLALYAEGRRLMRRGDYAAAAAAFERAAPRLDPERRAAARWLAAFARTETGQPFTPPPVSGTGTDIVAEAVAAALRGNLEETAARLAAVSNSAEALWAALEVAILRDDAVGAGRLVERIEHVAPGSVAALAAAASYRFNVRGDPTSAEVLLERAIALDPERPGLWNTLGLVLQDLDHLIEAEAAFRRALELAPGDRAAAGNLAILLLDTERVEAARNVAGRILTDDPGSYLGLRAAGRAALQASDPAARDLLLQALAAQPAAAETSILLAIAAHQEGGPLRAAQELDAAARLDPNDPVVPLVRSTIALDEGRADDAIRAAQEAARLYRQQRRVESRLAADRQSGSPLADAFASIGLDGWARDVADRTYDPLSASSLFGEATLSLPAIGRGGPAVDFGAAPLLQGLLLEPLAASYRLRSTDLLRRPFLDIGLGATHEFGDVAGPGGQIEVQGFNRLPAPLAFSATLNRSALEGPGDEDRDELSSGALYVGTQFGARMGGFASLAVNDSGLDLFDGVGFGLSNRDVADRASRNLSLGGFLRLGERRFVTMLASLSDQDSTDSFRRFLLTPSDLTQVDIDSRQDVESRFLSFGYRGDDPTGTWFAGVEYVSVDERTDGTVTTTSVIAPPSRLDVSDRTRRNLMQTYLGRRHRLAYGLEAEGLLTFDTGPDASGFGGRVGLVWSPTPDQTFRAAIINERSPDRVSLAPAGVVNLAPFRLAAQTAGRVRGALFRWDGTFGDRLHIGAEHQSLDFSSVLFPTGDALTDFLVPEARLQATTIRADYWMGGGIGLHGSVTHARGRVEGGAGDGGTLPETPEWTARIGAGLLTPSQVRAFIEGVWTSERFSAPGQAPLDPVFTLDAGLSWEPFDKHLAISIEARNLLDADVTRPWGLESTGRSIALAATARF